MLRRLVTAAANNAYLLLVLGPATWSINAVVGRYVAGHVPPIALGCLRWLLGGFVLLPFAWPHLKREWPVIRAHWRILTALAFMGVGCYSTLQYVALNYTTALNALVFNSSGPVMIALFCFAIFGDRLSLRQMLGVATSLSGVLTIVCRGSLTTLTSLDFNLGDLLLLIAHCFWAGFTALLRLQPKLHWLTAVVVSFFIGSAFNMPFVAVEHAMGYQLQPTLLTAATLVYVALFPTLVGYVFWSRGVELIGGARAGPFLHVVPLWGAVLAVAFLGERIEPYLVIGFVLIIVGVTMAARKA